MPIVVDKEKMRMDILMAFQRCIEKKPIEKITLRDIAAQADMSHPKLLNYFESKDDLILSYIKYTKDYMSSHCIDWFRENSRKDYRSNMEYLNAFMRYVAEGKEGEFRPNATTQTYVIGHYRKEVGRMIQEEFAEWRKVMEASLVSFYGENVGKHEAEAMMILIAGTFICKYNSALTGEINDNIIGYISNLSKS